MEELGRRREDATRREEPLGILTHHLVFDDEIFDFVSALFSFLSSHPAVRIVPANSLFQPIVRSAPLSQTSSRVDDSVAGVSVVVTSCGRQDLLQQTLDSFVRYNTYPVREIVVIEDGSPELNLSLEARYGHLPMRWMATNERIGQIRAIDRAYGTITDEYIFHCEDDWQFTAPGFIEKSLSVLRHNRDIVNVSLRALDDTSGSPVSNVTFFADETPFRVLQARYQFSDALCWHGYSFNPGLRRREDYALAGSFGSFDPHRSKKAYEVESSAAEFYMQRGFVAAILSDNDGRGYVRHLGRERHVPDLLEARAS